MSGILEVSAPQVMRRIHDLQVAILLQVVIASGCNISSLEGGLYGMVGDFRCWIPVCQCNV